MKFFESVYYGSSPFILLISCLIIITFPVIESGPILKYDFFQISSLCLFALNCLHISRSVYLSGFIKGLRGYAAVIIESGPILKIWLFSNQSIVPHRPLLLSHFSKCLSKWMCHEEFLGNYSLAYSCCNGKGTNLKNMKFFKSHHCASSPCIVVTFLEVFV